MEILDGRLLLSATDLVNFIGCRHATYLDLRDLIDPGEIPERDHSGLREGHRARETTHRLAQSTRI
jgi:hypothetical protein